MFIDGSFSKLKYTSIRLSVQLTICFMPCVFSLYPDILHISAEQISYLLKKTKIVDDVIKTAPKHTCMVSYFDTLAVELGNTLEAKELRYPPHWCRWTGDNSSYYTFLMIGPDEPSEKHPSERDYIHWLVGNIKGDRMLKEKEYIYEYVGPDPGQGTGKHRHVYLVYKQQNGKLKFDEKRLDAKRDDSRRRKFSNVQFANKYNLGDPVAVNFLFSEWGPNKSRYIPPRSPHQVGKLPTHPDYVWDPEERMPWYLSKKDFKKKWTPPPF